MIMHSPMLQHEVMVVNEWPNNGLQDLVAGFVHNSWKLKTSQFLHGSINNLINSMGRRCEALREANGGHTRY